MNFKGQLNILGISAFYHDSAAALISDGEVLAAAQEERFTRKKHDHEFPINAVNYCLKEAGLTLDDVDHIVFYDKPYLKFERLLETYFSYAPKGLKSFMKAMPLWLGGKLWIDELIRRETGFKKEILFTSHHESHAASAFFASPFKEAAVLTLDGVGEWATTSLAYGKDNKIEFLQELRFPHSLGLLYSAFTYFTGFKVNSGEYKLMGLAPYGEPKYVQKIKDHLIDIKPDGSFRLNMEYFDFCTGLTMTNSKFADLFDGPRREPESQLTQREMDLAKSIQVVTEEVMILLSRSIQAMTGSDYLCLAGGVALNCVGNGAILKEGIFKNIWIQPASGDAGGALGAALAAYYHHFQKERKLPDTPKDFLKGSYLGPTYSDQEIRSFLDSKSVNYNSASDDQELCKQVSKLLADGKVIGWFQGRMEFGPRALGNRSILGDPRSSDMQKKLNLKIKFRESFRPFAPSILRDDVIQNFQFPVEQDSPYMLITAPVNEEIRYQMSEAEQKLFGIEKLNVPRSTLPAITHVDYSARLQTVTKEDNSLYFQLLNSFKELTGCSVLINTSFNVRGEPIVCTPEDAYRCFTRTEMDYLILGRNIIDRTKLPAQAIDLSWQKEFELD
ncbi:MAG: carbamoyltransferase [Bdellovibrionales bacterium]